MVKVEVIEKFTLEKFDELKNIVRKNEDEKGTLFIGDTFECEDGMAKYLTGDNDLNKVVVKVIEVIPEVTEVTDKPAKRTTTRKRTTKKKEDK